MLVDIVVTMHEYYADWAKLRGPIVQRAQRYADILERSISPDGTYPVIGRSIVYRGGAFQLLAQMALRRELPEHADPAQVRGALTAVIRRTIEAPGTFDENGWLRIGLAGHQPELGETYISTGSLYLCSTVFLPLGLDENDPFWRNEEKPWSSKLAWSGGHVKIDKAL